ncbi:MAG: FecR domain-containing protein [Azonexus sp.]|nr:FecR domain-containing protein [Azonexus sp.]MCK6411642.1 FecR domain-containing protein [Azonexus sp.]
MNGGEGCENSRRAAEEAATWFLRRRDKAADAAPDAALEKDFQAWLEADALHRREYVVFKRLWSGLDVLERRKPRRKSFALATLAVLSLIALASFQFALSARAQVETRVAEVRSQLLDDGTLLEIDAGTLLEIDYSPWRRRVSVVRGQVQFTVASGWRPFEVLAAGASIRDIGTTFNLQVRHDSGRVSVQEGIVDVIPDSGAPARRLFAGQRLEYRASDHLLALPQPAPASPAWREGRWVFAAAPLDEVVEEINRHHLRPVRLHDPLLATYRVSGVYEQRDREGLLRALASVLPVRLEENGEETLLRRR